MSASDPDAVIVGSGPNGLAAALTLARAGLSVRLIEAEDEVGGGCRSGELTLPGFVHDLCSAVHPLAVASPFFAHFDAPAAGVEFVASAVACAHPLGGERAAAAYRSIEETAAALGADAAIYRRIMTPLVAEAAGIVEHVLSPMRAIPRDPVAFARFGLLAPYRHASLPAA
jgi:phytoene dehydrogenase-like protein